jgi:hypothetical protein
MDKNNLRRLHEIINSYSSNISKPEFKSKDFTFMVGIILDKHGVSIEQISTVFLKYAIEKDKFPSPKEINEEAEIIKNKQKIIKKRYIFIDADGYDKDIEDGYLQFLDARRISISEDELPEYIEKVKAIKHFPKLYELCWVVMGKEARSLDKPTSENKKLRKLFGVKVYDKDKQKEFF